MHISAQSIKQLRKSIQKWSKNNPKMRENAFKNRPQIYIKIKTEQRPITKYCVWNNYIGRKWVLRWKSGLNPLFPFLLKDSCIVQWCWKVNRKARSSVLSIWNCLLKSRIRIFKKLNILLGSQLEDDVPCTLICLKWLWLGIPSCQKN